VEAFGVTGNDDHARRLRDALGRERVGSAGLIADATRPTTVKQNLIGLAQTRHPQKMFRVDYESREPLSGKVVDHLIDAFTEALPRADVVCIEDYAKGVCTPEHVCHEVIARARKAGKPVLVDPARIESYEKYRGATVITPTAPRPRPPPTQDRRRRDDPAHNAKLAEQLLNEIRLEAVVLTLDKHGALLLERGAEPVAIPTIARRSTTSRARATCSSRPRRGAGQRRGLGRRRPLRQRRRRARGRDLRRRAHPARTRPPRDPRRRPPGTRGKLRTPEQAEIEIRARRASGQKIVFTNGCFDLLHAGHVDLLDKAAASGDFLIVGLNSDDSVKRLKGATRPVNSEEDRARVLGGLGCIGAVVVFDQDTPIDLIRRLKPDILVKGADYTRDKVVGAADVESWGGKVVLIDLVEGKSTTGMIRKMSG
jgi:D-beta-D-heptose 7-phosphate kinase/D-beta-D-heptose 1-phosphate adenosyltransferase